MKRCALLVVVFLGGCGGDGTPMCAAPSGLYMDNWQLMSGTCQPSPPGLVNFDTVPAPWAGRASDPGCTASIKANADCSFDFDESCPPAGTLPSMIRRGKVRWSEDGATGSGVVTIISTSSLTGRTCNSTYSVSWKRP